MFKEILNKNEGFITGNMIEICVELNIRESVMAWPRRGPPPCLSLINRYTKSRNNLLEVESIFYGVLSLTVHTIYTSIQFGSQV